MIRGWKREAGQVSRVISLILVACVAAAFPRLGFAQQSGADESLQCYRLRSDARVSRAIDVVPDHERLFDQSCSVRGAARLLCVPAAVRPGPDGGPPLVDVTGGIDDALEYERVCYKVRCDDNSARYINFVDSFGNQAGVTKASKMVCLPATEDLMGACGGVPLVLWGRAGSGNGQFNGLHGMTFATTGDGQSVVFVADAGNHRVQWFDTQGNYLGKWGTRCRVDDPLDIACYESQDVEYERGDGQFQTPQDVAVHVGAAGTVVYVSDLDNNRIQKFEVSSGNCFPGDLPLPSNVCFKAKWGSFCRLSSTLGCTDDHGPEVGDGQFSSPHGVAVDAQGYVYVADEDNHRIQKFNGNGGFITKWGNLGSGPGEFNMPEGVDVDAAGNVYVADTGNDRVQKFDANGNHLATSETMFVAPHDVVVDDSTGVVFVSDTDADQVQVLDASDLSALPDRWGQFGTAPGEFINPIAITTDDGGIVYVGEIGNDRVQVFSCPAVCGNGVRELREDELCEPPGQTQCDELCMPLP